MARKRAPRTTTAAQRVEWVLGAVAGAAVLAVLGYLTWCGVRDADGRVGLAVVAEAPVPTAGGFVVPLRVRNDGAETAAEVVVAADLLSGGEVVESSTVTIDYVPARSSAHAGVVFTRDPSGLDLAARVTGFTKP